VFLSRNLDQNMPKMRYILDKSGKKHRNVGAQPH